MKWRRVRTSLRARTRRWWDEAGDDYLNRVTGSRLTRQALASVLIFALAWIIHGAPLGIARRADDGLRYLVTTDYDFAGAWRAIANSRFWEGGLNLPVFRQSRDDDRSPGESPDSALSEQSDTTGGLVDMIWPANGSVVSTFGWRLHPVTKKNELHEGLDIAGQTGDPIVAVLDGVVIRAEEKGDYGKFIELDHGNGLTTIYAHSSELLVRRGAAVRRGDIIAKIGQTGNATSPHLHFEVREKGVAVDPTMWLNARGASGGS